MQLAAFHIPGVASETRSTSLENGPDGVEEVSGDALRPRSLSS